ncbi:MAG: septum formation initiator family protein [Clostridia bacterium]|nr:septum formation initiator family protein [Clostridia bacterium]
MNNKKTKSNKTINVKRLATRGLFCFAIIYISFMLISQQFDLSRLSAKERELDSQIEAQQRQATELIAQKEASVTNEYIERVAREKLGYMKPGEKVFIDASK